MAEIQNMECGEKFIAILKKLSILPPDKNGFLKSNIDLDLVTEKVAQKQSE